MLDIYDASPSQHPHPGLSDANINIFSARVIIMNCRAVDQSEARTEAVYQSEGSHLMLGFITTTVGTNFEDYIKMLQFL